MYQCIRPTHPVCSAYLNRSYAVGFCFEALQSVFSRQYFPDTRKSHRSSHATATLSHVHGCVAIVSGVHR